MLLAGPILTLALNILIMSRFLKIPWICQPFILLNLVDGELPLCIVVTLS